MATSWPLYFPDQPLPRGSRPIRDCPLLVFVGLTGVGKSTLLESLDLPLLPNRRELVDRYVLPLLGAGPAADRSARFERTRAYRQRYSGGLAHALAQCSTCPTWPLLFDGLRGEEELSYARANLPRARYVVLEASDRVRLERLLGRGDAFDNIVEEPGRRSAAARDLAERLFCKQDAEQILRWDVPEKELVAKLEILASERESYSPEGARRALAGSPAARFVDSERLGPAQVADEVRRFLACHDSETRPLSARQSIRR